ncbi:MAG: hypothetical protein WC222_06100 [Parachlamydiales bacterium]|jgi:hypothetical protein
MPNIDISCLKNAWLNRDLKLIPKENRIVRFFKFLLEKIGFDFYSHINAKNVVSSVKQNYISNFFVECKNKLHSFSVTKDVLDAFHVATGSKHKEIPALLSEIESFRTFVLPAMIFTNNFSEAAMQHKQEQDTVSAYLTAWVDFLKGVQNAENKITSIQELLQNKLTDTNDLKRHIKALFKNEYPSLALQFEYFLIRRVLNQHIVLETEGFNLWMRNCLLHLIEKAKKAHNAEIIIFCENHLRILLKSKTPEALVEEQSASSAPQKLFDLPTIALNTLPLLTIPPAKKKTVEVVHAPPLPYFKDKDEADIESRIKMWEGYINHLKETEQFALLDKELLRFSERLRLDATQTYLDTLSEEDLEKWVVRYLEVIRQIASNYYRLQRYPMPSGNVVALTEMLVMEAYVLNKLNIHSVRVTPRLDEYFSLGHLQARFIRARQQLYNIQQKGLKYNYEKWEHSRQYGMEAAVLYEIALHEGTVLLLQEHNPSYIGGNPSDSTLHQYSQKQYREERKSVREKLLLFQGDLRISSACTDIYERCRAIEPIGLLYKNYGDCLVRLSLGYMSSYIDSPLSNYQEQFEVINEELIRNYICSSEVNMRGGDYVFNVGHYTGGCPTQDMVYDDKLTFKGLTVNTSQSLQLMRTNKRSVLNTYITFSQEPHLIADKSWQRVFLMQTTNAEGLYYHLTDDPQSLFEIVHHIDKLDQAQKKNIFPITFWAPYLSSCAYVAATIKNLDAAQMNRLKRLYEGTFARLKSQLKDALENQPLSTSTLELMQAVLLCEATYAKQKRSDAEIHDLFKLYFTYTNKFKNDFCENQVKIDLLINEIYPTIDRLCKNNPSRIDDIISFCFVLPDRPRKWKQTASCVFESPTLTLNLRLGTAERPAEMTFSIPTRYRHYLKGFVDEAKLKEKHKGELLTDGTVSYFHVKIGDVKIWIPLSSDLDLFYMETPLPNLLGTYKLESSLARKAVDNLPQDMLKCRCMVSEDKKTALFLNEKGETRYQAELDLQPDNKIKFKRISQCYLSDAPQDLIFDVPAEILKKLGRLSAPNDLIFLGTGGRLEVVIDSSTGLSYIWNPSTNILSCKNFDGFQLNDAKIDGFLNRALYYSDTAHERTINYFQPTFNDYLLLTHDNFYPQLILKHQQYEQRLGKTNSKLEKVKTDTISSTIHMFEIDPEKGLCSENPADHYYLAYVLLTQGRYVEAKKALKEGYLRTQNLDVQSKEVFTWMKEWKDIHPNAKALKAYVYLLEQEIHEQQILPSASVRCADNNLEPLLDAFMKYKKIADCADSQMDLPEELCERVRFYALRCPSWSLTKGNDLLTSEDWAYYKSRGIESSKKLTDDDATALLEHALKLEIKAIEKAVSIQKEPLSTELKDYQNPIEGALFAGIDVHAWLEKSESIKFDPKPVRELADGLKSYYDNKDSYESELASELIEELEGHLSTAALNESKVIGKNVNFDEIAQTFSKWKAGLQKDYCAIKESIVANFNLKHSDSSLIHEVKGQIEHAEDLFKEGKQAVNQEEWNRFVQRADLTQGQSERVQLAYKEYLELRTQYLQAEKIIQLALKCKTKPEGSFDHQLLALRLQAKRPYCSKTHPLAKILLLIDEEQKIIQAPSQFKHYMDMLTHPSSFKQERWGGGKTTVIRNIILRARANGYFMAGVLTHAPLVRPHHRLLKQATAAYGHMAYLDGFSRDVQLDLVTIYREHRKYLSLIKNRGRIDQTMHSFLSLQHAHTLLVLDADSKSEKEFEQIRALTAYRTIIKERHVTGSDELDQVGNSQQYHNFANGRDIKLQSSVYLPGLNCMRLILTHKDLAKYKSYYVLKKPKDMNEVQRKEFLKDFARVICESLACHDLDQDLLQGYLRGAKKQKIIDFFDQKIIGHPKADQIMEYHIFLSQIINHTYDRDQGVKFIRSEDGIHTKPCFYASKPNENGETASLEMTVWDTCVDYMRNKAYIQAMPGYVNYWKKKVQDELLKSEQSELSSVEETPSAKEFFNRFGLALSTITEKDFPVILSAVNSHEEWLIEVITFVNFENYFYKPKRIEGNAVLASFSMKELWGSSGNTESARSLPSLVQRHPELLRQKGASGFVFANFALDLAKHPVETFDYTVPFDSFLASRLTPGSAFVDVGPYFDGKTNLAIAKGLSPYLPEERIVRFQGEEDKVLLLNHESKLRDDSEYTDLLTTNTIFSLKDTRGTNISLLSNRVNKMGLSSDTDVTNFGQAGMRDRKWGQGSSYHFIQDEGLQAKVQDEKKFKGIPLAARYVIVMIENEVAKQKKLVFATHKQSIQALSFVALIRALDASIENQKQYFEIRDAALAVYSEWLEKSCHAPLIKRARPNKKIKGRKTLLKAAKAECLRLERLLPSLQGTPANIVKDAIKLLQDDDRIEQQKYLLDFTDGTEDDENVASIEIAKDTEADADGEVDVDLDLDQSIDVDSSISKTVDETGFEEDKRRKRKIGRAVNPWITTNSGISTLDSMISGFNKNYSHQLYHFKDRKRMIGLSFVKQFDEFDRVYGTLPIRITHDFAAMTRKNSCQNWMHGVVNQHALLFHEVIFMKEVATGECRTLMGSYSDMQRYSVVQEKTNGKIVCVHYNLYSTTPLEEYGVAPENFDQFRTETALAKLAFGLAPLSQSDRGIIAAWLNAQPNKQKLISYFRSYCGNLVNNQHTIDLLELMNTL